MDGILDSKYCHRIPSSISNHGPLSSAGLCHVNVLSEDDVPFICFLKTEHTLKMYAHGTQEQEKWCHISCGFIISEMHLKLVRILILYLLCGVPWCALSSLRYKKNSLLFPLCPAGGWNPPSVRSRWCMTTWQLWAMQTLYECSKKRPTQTSAVWFASTVVSSRWASLTDHSQSSSSDAAWCHLAWLLWKQTWRPENRLLPLSKHFPSCFHLFSFECVRVCVCVWTTLHHVIPFYLSLGVSVLTFIWSPFTSRKKHWGLRPSF